MGRRTRSPNYPRLSLRDAIERVEKLYKKERTHKTTREAVAEGLGYAGLNGSSLGIISTLKQYGLLEEDAEGVRVSQDAVALIMLPEDEPERKATVQRAAFAPRLFSELHEEYGTTLPSDVSLRYALMKKGYSEKTANEAIRAYRDTIELVPEELAEYTDADEEDQHEVEPLVQPTEAQSGGSFARVRAGGATVEPGVAITPATVLQFQISQNSSALIELRGDVTQEALDRLAKILEAQKFVFPSEEQSRQPAIEQPAEQPAIEMPASE